MQKKTSVRLPSHIKPGRYEIMIKPDLEGFTFYGEETIFLEVLKPTREIILHAKELEIDEVSFKNFKLQISNFKLSYDQKAETATFSSNKLIPKGKGELKLTFRGLLNDKMRGFYRSSYQVAGKTKHMATSQFEATDARRAFPCFDEPAQKAIFDVTLIIPSGTVAISNNLETSVEEHASGYKIVKFAPSPKMSTYLLAFIVGEFEWIEGRTKDGVLVRIFTTPGKKHQGQFALDCAIRCIEFYNGYFQIPYPLPVLDLIAIPDFTSAAMENWGAVTYRESAILVDPEHTSAANKQWVAIVIAHELAHQWFGNLVTMRWWTDLWLNEGFASYMENFVTDKLFPQWDIMQQFVAGRLESALRMDGLKNTHPIEIEVRHPDEIGEIFDSISYAKGSAIIRMLAEYLGEKDFRDGLRHYLKKHAYGNTDTSDLWKAFEAASKKPVTKIMQNWTKKSGYPLIRVVEEPDKFVLSQSRFFVSPLSKKQARDSTLWQTPIKFLTEDHKTQNFLLNRKSISIAKPKSKWIKFNAGETSFFRTDYPAQMLKALQSPIKLKKLMASDRLGLVRDAFSMAESGNLPTTQALEFIRACEKELDYSVWTEITGGLANLDHLLYGQKYYPKFENYARGIYQDIAKKVGFAKQRNEKHVQGLLRSMVLAQHGSFGGKRTILHFTKLFQDYMKTGKKIEPDLRGAAYFLAAQNGGAKEFNFLISAYKKEPMHEEQERLGRSLGAFEDKRLLQKALEFALSEHVRAQDSPAIALFVGRNPAGRQTQLEFAQENWKTLTKRYGHGGHLLEWFILPWSKFYCRERAEQIEKFFKKNPTPGLSRSIAQILESIRANAEWLKRDGEKIGRWLK